MSDSVAEKRLRQHEKALAIIEDVLKERGKQICKGYDAAHDDEHWLDELLQAALCFIHGTPKDGDSIPRWPWDPKHDTRAKHSRRHQLIIAMALICAEIERLDRCKQQT